ncbi:MAG TPA: MlaD family protein [Chitinispirillaceae bacterium]|nr:MlaD family protein [Chitinispirillaceae bacterium]
MYEINRKLTWSSVKAGLVITLALVILLITVLFTGVLKNLFEQQTSIYARFANIEGLRPGAIVWLYGLESGNVNTINVNSNGAFIKMSLNKSAFKLIRRDATAEIKAMGIMGDKFIEINPGESDTLLPAYDTICGEKSSSINEMINSSASTLQQFDKLVESLAALIYAINDSSGSLGKLISNSALYDNFSAAAGSVKQVTDQIRNSKGTLHRIIKDSLLYVNLNNTVEELEQMTSTIRSTVGNIDAGMNNGSLAAALFSDSDLVDSLRQTISSYHTAATSISKLIQDIKDNPKKYLNFEVF